MKKQISFDDEITIRTVHYGNYLKDDGDQDEYVEGNYPFEIQMEIQLKRLISKTWMKLKTGKIISIQIRV